MKMSTADLFDHFRDRLYEEAGEKANGLFLSVGESHFTHLTGPQHTPDAHLHASVGFPETAHKCGCESFRCHAPSDAALVEKFEDEVLPKVLHAAGVSVFPEFDPIYSGM